jgi:hypothetical protein
VSVGARAEGDPHFHTSCQSVGCCQWRQGLKAMCPCLVVALRIARRADHSALNSGGGGEATDLAACAPILGRVGPE